MSISLLLEPAGALFRRPGSGAWSAASNPASARLTYGNEQLAMSANTCCVRFSFLVWLGVFEGRRRSRRSGRPLVTIRTASIAPAIPTGTKPSIAYACLSAVTEVPNVPFLPSRRNSRRR